MSSKNYLLAGGESANKKGPVAADDVPAARLAAEDEKGNGVGVWEATRALGIGQRWDDPTRVRV